MNDFVAIDVETANNEPSSICAIGAVKVRDGIIVDSIYTLIYPEPEYYSHFCTAVHGITMADTQDAPNFATAWRRIYAWTEGLPLVAHNAAFDHKCIDAACRVYRLEPPAQEFLCTLKAARRAIPKALCPSKTLPCVCSYLGIPFEHHHNAMADARGCAQLAMVLL